MITTTFGDFLHRAVRRRGWTMAAFAEQVGVSASTISRLRNGKRLPRSVNLDQWSAVLELDEHEEREFAELCLLAQAPQALRERIARAEADVDSERERRATVEQHYGEYRKATDYYDGWWLSYHYDLTGTGAITRSLTRINGDAVRWLNFDHGEMRYSYTGAIHIMGDKLFMQLEEDRGGVEHVQATFNSLFDLREPTFLYGIVAGISGKTLRHPISYPAAARIVLLYAANDERMRQDPALADQLHGCLGTFDERIIGPLFPAFLGSDDHLRHGLQLQPREDLNAVIRRMLGDGAGADGGTLQARF